ncbi:Ribosomal protein S18 acetylase RimI [Mucilaginibacter mallensis]|uniref:Ribosomal protein S18 acetylase RimI n=1 Tax=Mucilaginibacter mallensis TaxID=652787 RepID=A0A1H2AYB4_MUCMA|nr:GNAT family N-acetyltransferase [Mucilaginibacter mallensis]SDT50536.1 Ribosomal protein S18 acetylase RimI [Mucilaginibacter mallensis]
METITIRTATINDLDTLLRFEQGVIKAERPFDVTIKDGHVNYYDIVHLIEAPHIEIVVAESGSEIIGCGYARIENGRIYLKHKQHAYLGFMYVDPAHRGKGVNKLVIEALTKWAISQNMTELRLDVYDENAPAIRAYEKAGFSKHLMEMRKGLN